MYKGVVEKVFHVTIIAMKRSIFLLFFLGLLFISAPLNAQIGLTPSDVNVILLPDVPRPNEEVSVSLTSYILDINTATITWSVNGKVIKSGVGEKNFTFVTGDSGTLTVLDVLVQAKSGGVVRNTVRLRPVNVDIIWQSKSYTPPFFKGKAMFSSQNEITFIALPHIIGSNGREISSKNLVYKWSKNGSPEEALSGYGRNTLTIVPGVISRPMDITVEVSTTDSSINGFAKMNIAPSSPLVLLYKKNPAYGIEFQKALSGTVEMGESEITIRAVPLYFGTTDLSDLYLKWKINGLNVDEDFSQISRIFRPIEGTSGVSNISVSVEHSSKILQFASGAFNLKFGNTN